MNTNKHEMSDDELDRLFSESAEKMTFDFDPDSWTKMSQKLDAAAIPPSNSRGITPWVKRSLLLLTGLLAFVGVYYFLKPSPNQSKETLIDVVEKNKNKSTGNDSKKYVETSKVDTDNLKTDEKTVKTIEDTEASKTNITTNKSEILARNEENSSIEKSAEASKSVEIENSKTFKNRSKQERNSDILVKNTKKSNNTKDNIFEKNIINRRSDSKFSSNKLTETKDFSTTKSERETNKIQTFNNSEIANNIVVQSSNNQVNNVMPEQNRLLIKNLDLLSPKGTFIKSSIGLPIIAFENPQKETPVVPKSSPQSFKKGLYFRFGISPDKSLVTMNALTKSGSNLAFLLEYRFNNRLSIQGGVLRSTKHYDTPPQSYEFPYSWGSPPKMTGINATCKMLDIPVNVRYDISQKKLSRLFVSAGATSYIMLNEKYVYNYENPADPKIMWKSWEGKTGPAYLGVLNFSMGYEYQLFRKLSVQAEPFFKLPISQVGFGKVNLSTFGLLVSAKYPISIRK